MNTFVHLGYVIEFLLEGEMFLTKVAEKINTFFVQQYVSENRAFYEILWKNMVQPGRPQITLQYGDAHCMPNN
jgi:hypothetical protein